MDITERLLEVPTMGHDAGCVMEAAEEIRRLRAAIVWALGAGDEFKPQGTMDGKYWWRGELASRAGMQWNGDKYVTAPPRNGPACNLLRPWEEVASSGNLPELPTCTKSQTNEIERLRDLADEYNRLMRHMDAGGDFFAFQVAEASCRNAPVPNAELCGSPERSVGESERAPG